MNKIVIFSLVGLISTSLSTNSFAADQAPQGCWPKFASCMKKTTRSLTKITLTMLPMIIDILNGETTLDTSSITAISNSLVSLGEKNPLAVLQLEQFMQETTGLSTDKQVEAFNTLQNLGLIAQDGKVTSKEGAQFLQTLLTAHAKSIATPAGTNRSNHRSFKQIVNENKAARDAISREV